MILLKNEELTEKDLHKYRKRYIRFKIFLDCIFVFICLYIFGMLNFFQGKEGRSLLSTIVLVSFEVVCSTIIIIGIYTDFKDLIKKDVSFIVENGTFRYVSIGSRYQHRICYFLNFDRIYTHYTTPKPCIYDGKNVDVHFYINSKNKKEAFLINQLDKNTDETTNKNNDKNT